jgi:hypothetical protein
MATINPGTTVWVNCIKGEVSSTYRPLGTFREFRIQLETGEQLSRSRLDFDLEDPFQLSGRYTNIVKHIICICYALVVLGTQWYLV